MGGRRAPDVEPIADVRSLTARQLEGYDAVCHLAAISNDPIGDLNEALTVSVNRDGSIQLARIAKQAGVPRYLFSGSCSVWGRAGTARARAASRAGSHTRSATAWDWRRRWRSRPARYTPSRPCA
jgi:nucleoside-diphosphate-sugar epimerase